MRCPGQAFRRTAICLGFAVVCLVAPLGAATITVDSPADTAVATDGDCTLREVIANANLAAGGDGSGGDCAAGAAGADTIDFDAAVTGTITLGSALPSLMDNVVIVGPGAGVLTVDGATSFRVLEIDAGVTATISGLTIANGSALEGGGIYNNGTLTITHSTLLGNSVTAQFSHGSGGGIYNNGILAITHSTLLGNSVTAQFSHGSGGGIYNNGILAITNSTLSGNTAWGHYGDGSGGGIENGATLAITNSTLSGNYAPVGGGIENSGTVTITNSTLSGNSGHGGGIFNGGTVTIKSSIVANNLSGADCSGGMFIDLGGNLDTDAGCPLTTVSAAALNLGPLALNPPGTNPTHALLSPSAAIDAASDCNDAFGNAVTTDQRGVARPMDGDGDGVGACDSGAYELMIGLPIPVLDGLGLAILVALLMGAGLLLLRHAAAG